MCNTFKYLHEFFENFKHCTLVICIPYPVPLRSTLTSLPTLFCTPMHTHTHTCIPTRTYRHMHTRLYMHAHSHLHTCTHTTHTHTCAHTRAHTCSHIHSHVYIHMHTHTVCYQALFVLHVHSWICGHSLTTVILLEEALKTSPSSPGELSMALQLGLGLAGHHLLQAGTFSYFSLHRPCAGCHSCCELTRASAPLCSDNTVFLYSSSASDSSNIAVPSYIIAPSEKLWYRCPIQGFTLVVTYSLHPEPSWVYV